MKTNQGLPLERVLYFGFDDDRLENLGSDQLNLLLEEYFRRYPDFRSSQTVHWLLDEVQVVAGWDRFLRRAKDTEKMKFLVSGSSARLLSREVHTAMRGRGMKTRIGPVGCAYGYSCGRPLRGEDTEILKG